MKDTPCVNSILIDKHYEEQDEAIQALDNFLEEIQPHLDQIEESYLKIQSKSEEYTGYYFADEIDNAVTNIIYPVLPNKKMKQLKKIAEELRGLLK